MRNKNFEKFFYRLQYIILVLLAVCLYLSSSGHPVSYIIIAATALYIILFEIFLYLHNRNLKITSENILSFLDITARKRLTAAANGARSRWWPARRRTESPRR